MPATVDQAFGQEDLTGGATGAFTWTGRSINSGGRVVVATFIGNGTTATALTGLDSPNLDFGASPILAVVDSANENRIEWWAAWASGALTSEVITTTASGGNYNRRWFCVNTIAGSDANGYTSIGTATDVDSTPADPTLSVTAAATSVVLAALVGRGSGDTVEDGNTTQRYSSGTWAGFAFGARIWSRAGTGGATTLGSTGDDPLFWRMAGLEIKAAAAAGGGFRSRIAGGFVLTGG